MTGTRSSRRKYDEKKNLLLAANKDLPEGFFGKFSLSASDLVNYGSQGVLLPLNDLIEENAPNLKALFERRPDIKSMSPRLTATSTPPPMCRKVKTAPSLPTS